MGDFYKDKKGHFTDEENDGGECRHYNSQSDGARELADRVLKRQNAIRLPDEQLPRSLSAKWANEDIKMPNGDIAHFVEGSKITHKEVFAGKGTKTGIRDLERLMKKYPNSKPELWQKVKAYAEIDWNGEHISAEIHWYEEPSVGRIEVKYKKEL